MYTLYKRKKYTLVESDKKKLNLKPFNNKGGEKYHFYISRITNCEIN